MPSPVYDSDMARADAAVAGIWANEPLAYGANYFEMLGFTPRPTFFSVGLPLTNTVSMCLIPENQEP